MDTKHFSLVFFKLTNNIGVKLDRELSELYAMLR